jgi:hypothetical protein
MRDTGSFSGDGSYTSPDELVEGGDSSDEFRHIIRRQLERMVQDVWTALRAEAGGPRAAAALP